MNISSTPLWHADSLVSTTASSNSRGVLKDYKGQNVTNGICILHLIQHPPNVDIREEVIGNSPERHWICSEFEALYGRGAIEVEPSYYAWKAILEGRDGDRTRRALKKRPTKFFCE